MLNSSTAHSRTCSLLVTDRDHSESAVHNAGPNSGIDWTLDTSLHEDAGWVVENLLGRRRLGWARFSHEHFQRHRLFWFSMWDPGLTALIPDSCCESCSRMEMMMGWRYIGDRNSSRMDTFLSMSIFLFSSFISASMSPTSCRPVSLRRPVTGQQNVGQTLPTHSVNRLHGSVSHLSWPGVLGSGRCRGNEGSRGRMVGMTSEELSALWWVLKEWAIGLLCPATTPDLESAQRFFSLSPS